MKFSDKSILDDTQTIDLTQVNFMMKRYTERIYTSQLPHAFNNGSIMHSVHRLLSKIIIIIITITHYIHHV